MDKKQRKELALEIRRFAKTIEEADLKYRMILYSCNFLNGLPCGSKVYSELFKPENSTSSAWIRRGIANTYENIEEWYALSDYEKDTVISDQRITMLCFFAAMVESGDI